MRVELLGVLFLETEQNLDGNIAFFTARSLHVGIDTDLGGVLLLKKDVPAIRFCLPIDCHVQQQGGGGG